MALPPRYQRLLPLPFLEEVMGFTVPHPVKTARVDLPPLSSFSVNGDGGEEEMDDEEVVVRTVAALTYDVVWPFVPFLAAGLRMVTLPVMYGEDLVCYGYAFTL